MDDQPYAWRGDPAQSGTGPRRRGRPPQGLEQQPVSIRLRIGQREHIEAARRPGETFADTLRRLLDVMFSHD